MAIKSYRDLIAWQKAMDFAEKVYKATTAFPKEETYGLRSQLRKAAVSIPSNISEGQGRKSTSEFRHFLSIAYGSLCEAHTQVLLAQRFGYLSKETANTIIELGEEVGCIINGLYDSLPRKA
jgi:four helix bundle protein